MWARGVPLVARENSGGRGSRNEGSRLGAPRQVNMRHNPRNISEEDAFEASLRGSLILAEHVKKDFLIVLDLVLRGQELNLTREKKNIHKTIKAREYLACTAPYIERCAGTGRTKIKPPLKI